MSGSPTEGYESTTAGSRSGSLSVSNKEGIITKQEDERKTAGSGSLSVSTNTEGPITEQGDKSKANPIPQATAGSGSTPNNVVEELNDEVQPCPYLNRRFEPWTVPVPVNQRSVVHNDGCVSFLWNDQIGITYLTLFKTVTLEEEEPITRRLSEKEPTTCQPSDATSRDKDDNVAITIVHKTDDHVNDELVVYYDGALHKILPKTTDLNYRKSREIGVRIIDMTNCGDVIWAITTEGVVRRYNHNLEDIENSDTFIFRELSEKTTQHILGVRFARIATQNERVALFTVSSRRGRWSGDKGDVWVLDSGTWKCLYTIPDELGDNTGFVFQFTQTDGQAVLVKMTTEIFQVYCISIKDEPSMSMQDTNRAEFLVDFSPRTAYVKRCTPSAIVEAYAIKCLIRRTEFVYRYRGITDGQLETMLINSEDKLYLLSTNGELSIWDRHTKDVERRTQLNLPSSTKKLGFAGLTLMLTETDEILVRSHEQIFMFNRDGHNMKWNKSIAELNCVIYHNQKIYCNTSEAIVVLDLEGNINERYGEEVEARTIAVMPGRLEAEESSAADHENLESVTVLLPEQLTGKIQMIKINSSTPELTRQSVYTEINRFGPIVTDKNKRRMLVVDNSNGCVIVFNDNGVEECRLDLPINNRRNLTDRLIRSLCVSEDGTLYACTSNECYVADIQPTSEETGDFLCE